MKTMLQNDQRANRFDKADC